MKLPLSFHTAAIAVLAASGTAGFTVGPVMQKPATMTRSAKTVLFGIRCENKFYQLEEMEDKDTCTTELFLREDRIVDFGDTDGPLWIAAAGNWEVEPGTDNFRMWITRRYSAGGGNRDMGEFTFDVERMFTGEMTMVGESVAITGVASSKAAFSDEEQEVGYFNMIDATDVRLNLDQDLPEYTSKGIKPRGASPSF